MTDNRSCADIRAELAEARAQTAEAQSLAKFRQRELVDSLQRDSATISQLIDERDAMRAELDAIKAPIAGIEELGRIGWEAWQKATGWPLRPRVDPEDVATDAAEAQAIASRLIGALRARYVEHRPTMWSESEALKFFDRAVASLKIDAKTDGPPWLADAAEALGQKGQALNWSQVISEIRALRSTLKTTEQEWEGAREDVDMQRDELQRAYKEIDALKAKLATPEPTKAPTDTRPVVKVGQVWRDDYDGQVVRIVRLEDGEASVVVIEKGRSSSPVGEESWIGIRIDGTTYSGTWHLVTDTPEPVKVEPFTFPPGCLTFTQIANELTTVRERLAKLEATK